MVMDQSVSGMTPSNRTERKGKDLTGLGTPSLGSGWARLASAIFAAVSHTIDVMALAALGKTQRKGSSSTESLVDDLSDRWDLITKAWNGCSSAGLLAAPPTAGKVTSAAAEQMQSVRAAKHFCLSFSSFLSLPSPLPTTVDRC